MILGIERETAIFADAVLAGFFLCGVYMAICIFRRIVRHGLRWIAVEDICYWIAMAAFLFREMYRTCDGDIRWYFVLGTVMGITLGMAVFAWLQKICRILQGDFRGKTGKSIDKSKKRR